MLKMLLYQSILFIIIVFISNTQQIGYSRHEKEINCGLFSNACGRVETIAILNPIFWLPSLIPLRFVSPHENYGLIEGLSLRLSYSMSPEGRLRSYLREERQRLEQLA
jgi:hypothetical protein